MTLTQIHNIDCCRDSGLTPTFYFLASTADRSPALKTNTHCPEKCLKSVLFFLSCPESSSCLIYFSVDLCGMMQRLGITVDLV